MTARECVGTIDRLPNLLEVCLETTPRSVKGVRTPLAGAQFGEALRRMGLGSAAEPWSAPTAAVAQAREPRHFARVENRESESESRETRVSDPAHSLKCCGFSKDASIVAES